MKKGTIIAAVAALGAIGIVTALTLSKRDIAIGTLALRATQENRTEDDRLYTPSTQSLLREHSWLEAAQSIELHLDRGDELEAHIAVNGTSYSKQLAVHNLPAEFLVPRLHYHPASPADEFDSFNLMLAEYSRNGVSVPRGTEGDSMAHYTTNLTDSVPWKLRGDYDFLPNPDYCPLRFSVINNCLRPGLWELSAVDRTGEIYHSWFDMPDATYYRLVADVNGIAPEFAKAALEWREDLDFAMDLDRLRLSEQSIAQVGVERINAPISFSSQGSRRKLHKNYVQVETAEGEKRAPLELEEILQLPVHMSSFDEPGIYFDDQRRQFDFAFLAEPKKAEVRRTRPLTSYRWREEKASGPSMADAYDYIEIDIDLGGDKRLIIGNLPLELLVRQEDFAIHGFGVGILEADTPAERRQFLIKKGPCPSFAYLVESKADGSLSGLNSHSFGIEQIYLRSHPNAEKPYWELTITSFERIVDLVKYHIDIPVDLQADQLRHSEIYTPPVFFTYQDNNVN
jgi:hypothetical protein